MQAFEYHMECLSWLGCPSPQPRLSWGLCSEDFCSPRRLGQESGAGKEREPGPVCSVDGVPIMGSWNWDPEPSQASGGLFAGAHRREASPLVLSSGVALWGTHSPALASGNAGSHGCPLGDSQVRPAQNRVQWAWLQAELGPEQKG